MATELPNNLRTDGAWEIAERAFSPEQIVTTGSNFMIGNGYLGYRGTFSEWRAEHYVACTVTDTWDVAGGSDRSELCTVPNALYTELCIDGEPLSAFAGVTGDYRRGLNLRHGIHHRAQTWTNSRGKRVRLTVEKFASLDNVHLLALRYRFQTLDEADITLSGGIDGQLWSLGGEHFREYRAFEADGLIAMETVTHRDGVPVVVVEGMHLHGVPPREARIQRGKREILRHLDFHLTAGAEVVLEKVMVVYSGNDVDDPRQRALADAHAGLAAGYEALRACHAERWEAVWAASDIRIHGDPEAQTLVRFNLYQAIIATPTHDYLPIGARGLSCQVYQGAAFWDQEIFNLPMHLYTRPEVARGLLEYRHRTLDGARRKARRLGYYGAFYAWTSGKTGDELFPDYFFTDVLSGRRVRNHFNCWQIHVSPDIVYALWHYYRATGDWQFIAEHGAEIAFEVAQFLVSRIHFKKDRNRYELIRLLGPDEYHENVDNDAYTMYLARFALQKACWIFETLRSRDPARLDALLARLGLDDSALADWREIVQLIYLPQPDPETGLIEQCDGFFQLEDATPDQLRARLVHPEEYWGWPNGVAVGAQVLKQADVLQLFTVWEKFPAAVMRANYDYYEPRTEHGSSLSPAVHAMVACRVGYVDAAYRYFLEGASIDLYNASRKVMSGGSFLGGIHMAACGAVWLMVVKGFAGFRLRGDSVCFTPALPAHWRGLEFGLVVHGQRLWVALEAHRLTLSALPGNRDSLAVAVGDWHGQLAPGAEAVVELPVVQADHPETPAARSSTNDDPVAHAGEVVRDA